LTSVQPLGYYQNERCQGESRTKNHSHSRYRHVCCTTTTVLLEWQTAFYSIRTTVGRPIVTSFLKSKALPNIDREK